MILRRGKSALRALPVATCFVATVVVAVLMQASQALCAAAAPTVVSVGIRIDDLSEVDEVHERWGVTGLLITSWKQPNLAYHSRNQSGDRNTQPAAAVQIPNITFANATDTPTIQQIELFVRPDGTVFLIQDFHAMLSTDLDLRRFPFDTQDLPLVVLPIGRNVDQITLIPDVRHTQLVQAGYSRLSPWAPLGLKMERYAQSYLDVTQHGVRFDLKVRRNAQSYIWKFIVPLCLIVAVSWISFWLSPTDFKSKDLLGTAVTTLLIVVAFTLSITTSLPRTSYITYIDGFLLTCLVFVIVAVGASAVINSFEQRGQEARALVVRRMAGAILPVGFAVVQAIVFLAFWGATQG